MLNVANNLIILSNIMLSVVMYDDVMLSVMAPLKNSKRFLIQSQPAQ